MPTTNDIIIEEKYFDNYNLMKKEAYNNPSNNHSRSQQNHHN